MKKLIMIICACLFLSNQGIIALAAETPFTYEVESLELETEEITTLTVEDAIAYALSHNIDLMSLENQILLAEVSVANAKKVGERIVEADEDLNDAYSLLWNNKSKLKAAKSQLSEAQTALNAGYSPVDLEANGIEISQGDHIFTVVFVAVPNEDAAKQITKEIKGKIQIKLDENAREIEENEAKLIAGESILKASEAEYNGVIKDASREVESLLGYKSNIELSASSIETLMLRMGKVNFLVTSYASDIYKNQIAMLIRSNFYDALHKQNLMLLKEKSFERASKQLDIVKLSYENGMKAKDDYLLAKIYYSSVESEYRLAVSDFNNAIYALKTNMGMDITSQINLVDMDEWLITEEDLDTAEESGLLNRLEIQQCLGAVSINELNVSLVNKTHNVEDYNKDEAKLLLDQANLNLSKTKDKVRNEIYTSYELMTATADMLISTQSLVEEAEEVVKIAQLKYEQGMGASNALLANLNLESSSGTILELIAAEENLALVKTNVENIRHNYVLAKCKYYNDAAMFNENQILYFEKQGDNNEIEDEI